MSEMFKGGKMPILKNLQLETYEGTMAFYRDVIEKFTENGISENNLRALVYALSGYLNYWKVKLDLQLEERVEKLEDIAKENEERKRGIA